MTFLRYLLNDNNLLCEWYKTLLEIYLYAHAVCIYNAYKENRETQTLKNVWYILHSAVDLS